MSAESNRIAELEAELQQARQRISELESLAGDLRLGQGRLQTHLGVHGLTSRNDMQDILDAVLTMKSKLQEALRVRVNDEYRLSAADLDRMVNDAPPASEIGWAVKDLLLAHYELTDLKEKLQEAEAALRQANKLAKN